MIAEAGRRLDELELRSLFSGEHDERDAVCQLQSGEGGADAQDWAEMLLRMYLRWAERRGFDVEVDAVDAGAEAGHQLGDVRRQGPLRLRLAPGRAGRAPAGADDAVQRAGQAADGVRGAVGRAAARRGARPTSRSTRRTSRSTRTGRRARAASTSTSPTRRCASPTCPPGIVVSCQNERSQHQNRDRAMTMLKAKLADLERQQREDELAAIRGEQQRVGFGSQIRSYVLQPYQMVKDLRTEHETGNVDGVLDGDLDPFMEAYLRWRRAVALPRTSGDATGNLAARSVRDPRPVSVCPVSTLASPAMIKLENVTKVYKGDVVALQRRQRRHPEGRVRLPRGPVRLGQVDDAAPPQQGGDARRRAASSWPARTSAQLSSWKVPVPAPQHRLRLPGLQAADEQDRVRERGLRPRGDRPAQARHQDPGAGHPRAGRPGQEAGATSPTSSPAASSSGCRSPGRSSTGR